MSRWFRGTFALVAFGALRLHYNEDEKHKADQRNMDIFDQRCVERGLSEFDRLTARTSNLFWVKINNPNTHKLLRSTLESVLNNPDEARLRYAAACTYLSARKLAIKNGSSDPDSAAMDTEKAFLSAVKVAKETRTRLEQDDTELLKSIAGADQALLSATNAFQSLLHKIDLSPAGRTLQLAKEALAKAEAEANTRIAEADQLVHAAQIEADRVHAEHANSVEGRMIKLITQNGRCEMPVPAPVIDSPSKRAADAARESLKKAMATADDVKREARTSLTAPRAALQVAEEPVCQAVEAAKSSFHQVKFDVNRVYDLVGTNRKVCTTDNWCRSKVAQNARQAAENAERVCKLDADYLPPRG